MISILVTPGFSDIHLLTSLTFINKSKSGTISPFSYLTGRATLLIRELPSQTIEAISCLSIRWLPKNTVDVLQALSCSTWGIISARLFISIPLPSLVTIWPPFHALIAIAAVSLTRVARGEINAVVSERSPFANSFAKVSVVRASLPPAELPFIPEAFVVVSS